MACSCRASGRSEYCWTQRPATGTLQLVEALKNQNMRFDMLILPNFGHEVSDYVTQRAWDYFVGHLLGGEPPRDFVLRAYEALKKLLSITKLGDQLFGLMH